MNVGQIRCAVQVDVTVVTSKKYFSKSWQNIHYNFSWTEQRCWELSACWGVGLSDKIVVDQKPRWTNFIAKNNKKILTYFTVAAK